MAPNRPQMHSSTAAVMGRRVREGGPEVVLPRWIPVITLLSIGIDEWSLGSGSPSEICMSRTAVRYDLAVCGAKPWSARDAAKVHKGCSVTEKGDATLNWTENE